MGVVGRLPSKAAAGTSVRAQNYAHADEAPPAGTVYYRLVRVDNDGVEEIYPVRQVYISGSDAGGPVLSPNPVINDLAVTIPEMQEPGPVSVRIFAADGRLVHTRHTIMEAGRQRLDLVLPALRAGLYQTVIEYDKKRFVRALTVR